MLNTLLRRFKPKILDRYILLEILGPLLGGVTFFVFVFLMFQALRLAEFFIIHGVAGRVLIKMIGLLTLSFLPTALPVAFLISILISFGRFSADSELVAMKANGVSIYRLTVPALFVAVIVAILSAALNLEWVPSGEREFKRLLIKVSNTKVVTSIHEGTFTSGFFDLLLYADKVDVETNRMEKVFLFDEREAKQPLVVVAKMGEIISLKTESELGAAIMLKLYDGNIHSSDLTTGAYQKIDFGEYKLFLKVAEGNDGATVKPRMYPYEELKQKIASLSPKTPERLELEAEYWRRYSYMLVPFLFVFLGIGFGTVRTRAVRSGAALVAFLVLMVYWGLLLMSTVLAQKGYLPPIVSMQIPNLIVLIAAVLSFRVATW